MRRYSAVCGLLLSLIILSSCSSAGLIKPDYYQYYTMSQGWYESQLAWFICLDTNDLRTATSDCLPQLWSPWFLIRQELAPKLSFAIAPLGVQSAARAIYIVTNYQQGPVFSEAPGSDGYSALWQVYFVTFTSGQPRAITNTSATSDDNPSGLPDASEAEIRATDIVLDCSIVALGRLTRPTNPASEGTYRIPQAIDWELQSITKSVLLPHYLVYTSCDITGQPTTAHVLICDAQTPELAAAFGANLAPGLAKMPDKGTDDLWIMKKPYPVNQLPVLDAAPDVSRLNRNYDYSPISRLQIVERYIPQSATVKTPCLIHSLLGSNRLKILSGSGCRVNAHVAWVD